MTTLTTPAVAQPAEITRTLSEWQTADWKGFLHPGDLGWHSMVGAEKLAADLRCWTVSGSIVAIGMFDGDDLFRMAMDPSSLDDDELARRIEADLMSVRVRPPGPVTVEARGARALQARLRARGWVTDKPWTPLQLDLRAPGPRESTQRGAASRGDRPRRDTRLDGGALVSVQGNVAERRGKAEAHPAVDSDGNGSIRVPLPSAILLRLPGFSYRERLI